MFQLKGVCIVYFAKSFQRRRKYHIDPEHFVAVLRERGQPPHDASLKAPCGYWFLVAVSLSGCSRPSDKYVLIVYKYWRDHRGSLLTSLGNFFLSLQCATAYDNFFCFLGELNEREPLEGDEIPCVQESNGIDEVIEGVQKEEVDRTELPQPCKETLRPQNTVGMIM